MFNKINNDKTTTTTKNGFESLKVGDTFMSYSILWSSKTNLREVISKKKKIEY